MPATFHTHSQSSAISDPQPAAQQAGLNGIEGFRGAGYEGYVAQLLKDCVQERLSRHRKEALTSGSRTLWHKERASKSVQGLQMQPLPYQ